MGTNASRVGSTGSIKSNVKRAGQKAAFSPVMEVMTRVGYGVCGIVYMVNDIQHLSPVLTSTQPPTKTVGIAKVATRSRKHWYLAGRQVKNNGFSA